MTADERITILRDEILRWNLQISLVSRIDPSRRVDELIVQCREAWTLVEGWLRDRAMESPRLWIDLGSGAGLPGLVWAAERAERGLVDPWLLVEPREKRAWFLNRCGRSMGLVGGSVLDARWGEGRLAAEFRAPNAAVVSIKALKLDDAAVLEGMGRYQPLERLAGLAITRFLGTEDRDLEGWLEEFAPDRGVQGGWKLVHGEVLVGRRGRLLVTEYRGP